jgi:hypothetical protein
VFNILDMSMLFFATVLVHFKHFRHFTCGYQPPPPPPPPPPPEEPPPPLPEEEPGAVEEEEMAPGRDVPRLEAKLAIFHDLQVLPVYQVGR